MYKIDIFSLSKPGACRRPEFCLVVPTWALWELFRNRRHLYVRHLLLWIHPGSSFDSPWFLSRELHRCCGNSEHQLATSDMGIEAWYMDDSNGDQRKPHRLVPNQPASMEDLKALGVFYWKVTSSKQTTAALTWATFWTLKLDESYVRLFFKLHAY